MRSLRHKYNTSSWNYLPGAGTHNGEKSMQHKLEFTVHVLRPVFVVYDHLAQPENFIGLQPLLSSISSVQEMVINNKRGYRYETVETFRMGPLPVLNNRICVQTVLTEPGRQLDTVVLSRPHIRLDVHYKFTSLSDETKLVEKMLISVPAWLSGYVVRTARRVQEQTLANLKHRLETEESSAGLLSMDPIP
jgi:hypothetical protein